MNSERYITVWRKTGMQNLDWDFHVSENITDAHRVVANITDRGVHQFSTYELGAKLDTLSSRY